MSESAKELYSKRGEVILGPDSGTVSSGYFMMTVNGTRVNSVVEAGKSYIITFNSNDSEWANMSLVVIPGFTRTPLKQLNSNTYIVKFTATGAESGIGIENQGSGRTLPFTNYTLYEYQNQNTYPDNVLRPFKAKQMYYRNQEVQKLYLGSRLLWELQQSEPILISSATVGIHPNYVWIESRTLGDYRNQIEGRIKRIVLDGKVTINHPFEYDTWSDYLIELEGHPDNPMIYEEIRNKLGRQSAFSDVQVAIYTD